MNCKPGDLAVIVFAPYDPQHLGKIVTVKHRIELGFGIDWVCDPQLFCNNEQAIAWNERSLRPIRDPGDDAVDEFLALTGKPDYREKIAEKMKERV